MSVPTSALSRLSELVLELITGQVKCKDCGAFGHRARNLRCPIRRWQGALVLQPLGRPKEKENVPPRCAPAPSRGVPKACGSRLIPGRGSLPKGCPATQDQKPQALAKDGKESWDSVRVKCKDCGAFGHRARNLRCPIRRWQGALVLQPLGRPKEKENVPPRCAPAPSRGVPKTCGSRLIPGRGSLPKGCPATQDQKPQALAKDGKESWDSVRHLRALSRLPDLATSKATAEDRHKVQVKCKDCGSFGHRARNLRLIPRRGSLPQRCPTTQDQKAQALAKDGKESWDYVRFLPKPRGVATKMNRSLKEAPGPRPSVPMERRMWPALGAPYFLWGPLWGVQPLTMVFRRLQGDRWSCPTLRPFSVLYEDLLVSSSSDESEQD
ncbi:protein FAM90A27P-like [Sorex araneus]|uniref:protein FAM90A27P-like n=1 Tax=Sorex araneus TaxID=42254 RepID=UPI002433EAD5|nr:protein FAM90A27P-like [Sorex araneus]